MASEVKSITSESLEAAYRALTPSQSGFTQDLMASNTIIPVLDLTASASGSSVPEYQAQAWAAGTTTATADAATVTLINQTGFWKCFFTLISISNNNRDGSVQINDGASTTTVFEATQYGSTGAVLSYETIIFLPAGHSIELVSSGASMKVRGSCRQIADVNGNVVYPSGFTPQ